jgi:glutamate synthase domain-containing protein 3
MGKARTIKEYSASGTDSKTLNEMIRNSGEDALIRNCLGERFIASGASNKTVIIEGTPGNALGAYLDGADIVVKGNAQDAVGDTMNNGNIFIHGSSGDTTGYAMRGGRIFVRDNTGYRAGVHMKQYEDHIPAIIIGGQAGSFLGEYLAGGIIVVLGLNGDGSPPVGGFCGTGMHGGRIYLRCRDIPPYLPEQVLISSAAEEDMREINPLIQTYAQAFKIKLNFTAADFIRLTPDNRNPYRRLYVYSL